MLGNYIVQKFIKMYIGCIYNIYYDHGINFIKHFIDGNYCYKTVPSASNLFIIYKLCCFTEVTVKDILCFYIKLIINKSVIFTNKYRMFSLLHTKAMSNQFKINLD